MTAGTNPVAPWLPTASTGGGVQDPTTYKGAIDGNFAVATRVADLFAPHPASPAAMSVVVDAGFIAAAGSVTEIGQQTVTIAAAPSAPDNRIDLVVVNAATGVAAVIAGTPATTAVAPALPATDLQVAQVSVPNGTIAISNGNITDLRAVWGGSGGAAAFDSIVASQAHVSPWEDFDRPDGTLLQGLTSKSGHTIYTSGPGAATVEVDKLGARSPGSSVNVYCAMVDDQPVIEAWGVFSFDGNPYTETFVSGAPLTIIFSGSTSPTTVDLNHGLIHLTIDPISWSFLRSPDTPADLVATTGTISELNSLVSNGAAMYHRGRMDRTRYAVGMKYIYNATAGDDAIELYLPDGRIVVITGDTAFQAIMANCTSVIWQITGETSGNPIPRWDAWQIGPRKADTTRAMGSGGDTLTVASLSALAPPVIQRYLQTIFTPSGTGWYRLATHTADVSTNHALGGHVRIFASSHAGERTLVDLDVGCEATIAPVILPRPVMGQWAAPVIDQVRITQDGSGNIGFDIHIATYTNTNDFVAALFDGQFTPVLAPTVGATALSGGSGKTVSLWASASKIIASRPADLSFGLTGVPGYVTIATQVAQAASHVYLAGRVMVHAIDTAGREDFFEFSLKTCQAGNTPALAQPYDRTGYYGGYIVDTVRVSQDDTNHLGQLDLHFAESTTISLCEIWFEGLFVATTTTPAVGASALPTVTTSLTLA